MYIYITFLSTDVRKMFYIKIVYINIAVKIKSHILLKRKVRKIFLKTLILIKFQNKMLIMDQNMLLKKKAYINKSCFKMIRSNQKLLRRSKVINYLITN